MHANLKQITQLNTLTALLLEKMQHNDITIAAVSGFAGAGKTTLCRSILKALPNTAHHFECDRFSRHSFNEREKRIAEHRADIDTCTDEANPRHWYDWSEIEKALHALRKGRRLDFSRAWNPKSGELNAHYTLHLGEAGPVLVLCDGIFLLHEPVRDWFDATIFVDCPAPLRHSRGQRRTKDPDRHAYMRHLERTYCEPYFREFTSRADVVYRNHAST
ncbi:uridine kinase family protein [Roseibium marinum]|uniref:Uridine kinase n=1 Tax=Roseibium marinum TaxID=281252 RepID=A0A2S3UY90_9HYPH|nr:NB-ARC domain-containing protein [Roseibium marinum]POF32677.1 uridine kinase [Roseibium marinum]